MYNPPAFVVDDVDEIHRMMRDCRLANFVTATSEGPMSTFLPMVLDQTEGEMGVLYAHLARPNPQWKAQAIGDGLAVFLGPDAYVTPSWYAAKAEHGKVVPTWNYQTVQARGLVEFFEDADRLLDIVTRLTNLHEGGRKAPWAVSDAPAGYIAAQLRGIVGMRMPLTSLVGKRKMSQNRSEADRAGVRAGMEASDRESERLAAAMVPA